MSASIPMPGTPVRGSSSGAPIMALFDLLGRAWGMGIIWNLQDGPYTFRELQAACDGVSPTLLNRRLKELRATGLAERCDGGYRLTDLGSELCQMLVPMGKWSKTWADAIAE